MKIGYQGDIGSNSEAAAKQYFEKNNDIEFVPLLSSEGVFQALMAGSIEVGVAAIRNSLAGEVQETKNALNKMNSSMPVCTATVTLPIHHCLFSKIKNIQECGVVMSHPQALKQTKNTREREFKWLSELEIGDQAKAAKDLSEGHYPENYAVICRKNAGENVGLTLIAENIEDDPSNETTFGIFVKEK